MNLKALDSIAEELSITSWGQNTNAYEEYLTRKERIKDAVCYAKNLGYEHQPYNYPKSYCKVCKTDTERDVVAMGDCTAVLECLTCHTIG